MLNLSAYAEQMLIHEHACVAIDRDMPLDHAAILGCAVTTGPSAVFNATEVTPGQWARVVGSGGVGLGAIQWAKISGRGQLISVNPGAAQRARAGRRGRRAGD